MGCDDCHIEDSGPGQRKLLWSLLAINGVLFFVEGIAGWMAQSSGLLADALDMLADAAVYGISLAAVGGTLVHKKRAAMWSGSLQMLLALGLGAEVIRRVVMGSSPEPLTIGAISALAFAGNVTCLALLQKHRQGEIHMRASYICSRNDVLANISVFVGGLLVYWTGTRWPDLIAGALITIYVFRESLRILREARQEG